MYWEKLGWLLDIGLLDLDYVMFWLIAGGVLISLLLWFLGGKVKGWFCFSRIIVLLFLFCALYSCLW